MRTSNYRFFTSKDILTITDKNFIYKFMLKSGLIRKISSGIYIWLPLGIKIINKIKKIITDEMKKIGGLELLLPTLQPIDFWYKSKRFFTYGDELMKVCNRNHKTFILSPTNEEIVSDLIEKEHLIFEKDLPILFYQITQKYRDEQRPKFGVMRCKEFLMKEAYSFHYTQKCLSKTYETIIKIYKRCFDQINLKFFLVKANSGNIGGSLSHEFHVLTKNGEDKISISNDLKYITNIEISKKQNIKYKHNLNRYYWIKNKKKFKSILQINSLKLKVLLKSNRILLQNFLRTIFIKIKKENKYSLICILIHKHQKIHLKKIAEYIKIDVKNITIAENKDILNFLSINCKQDFYGPLGLKIPIIIDENISNINNFIIGANTNNNFFINVNWGRDICLSKNKILDICYVVQGDLSANTNSKLTIKKSMEIAHIFQLGNKYLYKNKSLFMGCYGIGINRLLLAIIEQKINRDKVNIIFPKSVAPFQISIIPINMYNSKIVYYYANKLYKELIDSNIDVLLDDRKKNPGLMFNDMELTGIPYFIVLNEKNLKLNKVEYQNRIYNKKIILPIKNIKEYIQKDLILN